MSLTLILTYFWILKSSLNIEKLLTYLSNYLIKMNALLIIWWLGDELSFFYMINVIVFQINDVTTHPLSPPTLTVCRGRGLSPPHPLLMLIRPKGQLMMCNYTNCSRFGQESSYLVNDYCPILAWFKFFILFVTALVG